MTAAKPTAILLAQMLDISRRTFHDYVARGILPARGSSGWDVQAVVHAYFRYLKQKAESSAEIHKLRTAQTRLLRITADKVAMDLAARRAQVVPCGAIAPIWSEIVGDAKHAFHEALDQLVVDVVEAQPRGAPAICAALTARIDQILTELSKPKTEVTQHGR